jgi:hypothetical protein
VIFAAGLMPMMLENNGGSFFSVRQLAGPAVSNLN